MKVSIFGYIRIEMLHNMSRSTLAVIFLVILQNYFVVYGFYRPFSLGSDPQISRVLMSSTIDGITFT